ncbi:MAG: UDP-N-acetylmuramoyl-L-alanyl-D-glutamate--2,6-diaminopimelate ligase [Geminicoccaceae bacterium]|nr:UDP-N-acetylmuramoyl-L-alanyl-D-glutamate--2,6-diaminopimelate ligase [Geminicoccaceae bacterium]
MKLSALLDDDVTVVGDADIEIGGICFDTRKLRPGDLYAAISGNQVDGHVFIPEALAKGAVALMGGRSARHYAAAVPVVVDENPRLRLTRMAARMHPGQPGTTVAVTGTNGKTSVASFTRQIWDRLGMRAASLGTLGVEGKGRWPQTQLTTPDPVLLHRLAAQLAVAGVDHLVIEASSHGLHQFRLDALTIRAGAFTNISRDHFDYHGDFESYFDAKSRLFRELLPTDGTAVLNADVPEFERLAAIVRERGIELVDYGRKARRMRILDVVPHAASQTLKLDIEGRPVTIDTALVGDFQASNILAGLGLAIAGGADMEKALGCLPHLRGAPGRMQLVVKHRSGAPAFVDYAHTPDALEKALRALRPHTARLLHVVFGCGGDRDAGKRPLMGRIAGEFADRLYVTDDNPRNERPAVIRARILAATPPDRTVEIGDRAEAIRTAFAALEAGDVLVVAGKGHEAGQIVGTETLPFDDVAELRAAAQCVEGVA